MRSWDEIEADAVDEPPFSNGFEAESWMARWCETCKNDASTDCPLVGMAITMGLTPKEWKAGDPGSLTGRWRCTEYERRAT